MHLTLINKQPDAIQLITIKYPPILYLTKGGHGL